MSGMFDNIRDKAEKIIADNPDKLEQVSDQVIDKVGDASDKVTGGKFSEAIDSAEEQADKHIGS